MIIQTISCNHTYAPNPFSGYPFITTTQTSVILLFIQNRCLPFLEYLKIEFFCSVLLISIKCS